MECGKSSDSEGVIEDRSDGSVGSEEVEESLVSGWDCCVSETVCVAFPEFEMYVLDLVLTMQWFSVWRSRLRVGQPLRLIT